MIIKDINDVGTLESMLLYSKSRGQKQRIKTKIAKLKGEVKEPKEKAEKKVSAKDRVQNMMKKRE